MTGSPINYVLLAACRDDEKSYEFHNSDKKAYGTFLYALYKVLRSYMDVQQTHNDEDDSSNTGGEANYIDQTKIHDLNAHRLLELNWLDIFPLVVSRVQKLRGKRVGHDSPQTPQLVGLCEWRVFGCEPKPMPKFFPAVLQSEEDWDDAKKLDVKLKAGYLHGIEPESLWDLEFVRAPKSGEPASEISVKLPVIGLSIREITATESLMEAFIKIPDDDKVNKRFFEETSEKTIHLKAIQRFTIDEKAEMEEILADIPVPLALEIRKGMQYANSLFKWANLADRYKITCLESNNQSQQLVFETIAGHINLISSDIQDYLKFFKNVELFIRYTRLLELNKSVWWRKSNLAEIDKVMIEITLMQRSSSPGSVTGQREQVDTRKMNLFEKLFTKESPLEVREGENLIIEAWTTRTESVLSKSLFLTILRFGTDCAINVLHPLPGRTSKPLFSVMGIGGERLFEERLVERRKTRIGQLNGRGRCTVL